MTSKNLLCLTAQLFLKFLLITQHEVRFINTSEATKRSSNRTENGKCTDVTNRWSRVGLSTPLFTQTTTTITRRQICHCLAYLETQLCIITDRTNQRSWPDAGQIFVISMEFSAVNRRRPSRETPLGPGAKKDGCFRRLHNAPWLPVFFLRLWLADHLGCVWGRTARTMICVQALTFFAILPSRATRPSRSPRFSLCSLEIRQKSRLLCRHKFYRSSAPFFLDLPQEEIMSFSEAICKILGREAAESATKSRKDTEGYWKNKTKNFSESLSSHSDQNVWFSMPSYGAEWKFMS